MSCNAQHGIFVELQSGQSIMDLSKGNVFFKNIFQGLKAETNQ